QPDYNPSGICFDAPARPRAPLAVTAESSRAPLAFFARVGETGEVEDVRLGREGGDAEATNRALELLRSASFTPARRAGRAVAAWTDVSVEVNAAAGAVSVAAGCDDSDFGARNPDRACYDTRPAPHQAPVIATPPGCGTAPTPVTVRVRVDDQGRVQGDPTMVTPSECPGFTAAARGFVIAMTFNPATKDGHAVSAWTQLLVQPAPSSGG